MSPRTLGKYRVSLETRECSLLLPSLSLYVCVLVGCRPDEVVVPKDDPMVQELSDVLREWTLIWKRLYAVEFPSSFSTHTLSL